MLPDAGWVDMEDSETGQRVLVDTSHGPTRTRVSVAAERQLQERTRKLIQAGVDRVALQTSVPYSVPFRRAFAWPSITPGWWTTRRRPFPGRKPSWE